MRRKEFEMMDAQETEHFLQEVSFGVLGTTGEDGWPELTPVNFVFHEGALYFHGSKIGQKMANLKARPQITFSVAKEYAIVPSYVLDPKLACPATAYFKSVVIKGYGEPVDDLQQKAEALGAFMRKLQPEGGYDPIDAADPAYVPQLRGTSVVRIRVERITGKYKFGQNLKEPKLSQVIDGLEQRGGELDAETIALMKAYCPHHQEK